MLGKKRLEENKHLEYKFRYPITINEKSPRLKEIANRNNEALYIANPMDAIFTLYADKQEELLEIFQSLITECAWNEIETIKKEKDINLNISKPQKGSKKYSIENQTYTTLEYNSQPGFSEKQI